MIRKRVIKTIRISVMRKRHNYIMIGELLNKDIKI